MAGHVHLRRVAAWQVKHCVNPYGSELGSREELYDPCFNLPLAEL